MAATTGIRREPTIGRNKTSRARSVTAENINPYPNQGPSMQIAIIPAAKVHCRLGAGQRRNLNTSRAIRTEKKVSIWYCFSSRDQITSDGLEAHKAIATRAVHLGMRSVRITRYVNGTQAIPKIIGSTRSPTSGGPNRLASSFVQIPNIGAIGRSG
jgi:hypothetical protein